LRTGSPYRSAASAGELRARVRVGDPESFLEELFGELSGVDVSRGTVQVTAEHEEPRVERIVEGTAGSDRVGYRWREVTCLETGARHRSG
jgi:hypothetical protein